MKKYIPYSFYQNPRAQFHIEGILLRVLLEFYLIQMRAQLEGGFNERAGSIRRNTVTLRKPVLKSREAACFEYLLQGFSTCKISLKSQRYLAIFQSCLSHKSYETLIASRNLQDLWIVYTVPSGITIIGFLSYSRHTTSMQASVVLVVSIWFFLLLSSK